MTLDQTQFWLPLLAAFLVPPLLFIGYMLSFKVFASTISDLRADLMESNRLLSEILDELKTK